MMKNSWLVYCTLFASSIVLFVYHPGEIVGQDLAPGHDSEFAGSVTQETTFKQLPGYKNYEKIRDLSRKELSRIGRVSDIKWAADFKALLFKVGSEKRMLTFDDLHVGEVRAMELHKPKKSETRSRPRVGRALQRESEPSPDGTMIAQYRDFNLFLKTVSPKTGDKSAGGPSENSNQPTESKLTTDGTERLRFGTCCWVYGEELDQNDAIWWSDDSRRLAFYEVNEAGMKDYFLTTGNTKSYTDVLSVRYPKAGDDNPKVSLLVYDLDTKETKRLEIPGEPMQYLFNIRFLPNSHELLVSRTNRRQDKLDLLAIDADSGSIRTVLTETQDSWQENRPAMRMLKDGKRFVWETERSGFKQFELRHVDGRLLNALSPPSSYPCNRIIEIDEDSGWVYYTAFSAKMPYNAQLHRVQLDGSKHTRITTSRLNHTTFSISPDHKWVVSRREQINIPPSTIVYSTQGEEVATLNAGSNEAATAAHLSTPELFSFTANDGKTAIYGTMHFPSNFDASRKYPLLIDVYGGPTSGAFSNRYRAASPICELGFIVAKIGNRGTAGRGKAFTSSGYMKLGDVDLQDQADGVKFLRSRPYIDGSRVGIYGHSYGGYMSALALLRHPDVFHVGVAGAPVTTWKNYDTIYTERYMRTPQENKQGYLDGSCTNYVENLKGRLLLVHGLIDDNVHPANTWQLARKLQDAGKRFDMMIYPGFKHGVGSTYSELRWEYFHKHLRPEASDN